jgi:rRNA maturation protein Nop10
MSHLWVKHPDGEWQAHSLRNERCTVSRVGPMPLVAREQLVRVSGPVLVRTDHARGLEDWVLLCSPRSRTRINGLPVPVGARVLADRDAIAVGAGHTVFFSSERVAEIVPFPDENGHTCCVRCKLPIEPGTPAVRCPSATCGFWHHQTLEQPCWTYTDACPACGHPTDLDAGLQWSPADL